MHNSFSPDIRQHKNHEFRKDFTFFNIPSPTQLFTMLSDQVTKRMHSPTYNVRMDHLLNRSKFTSAFRNRNTPMSQS